MKSPVGTPLSLMVSVCTLFALLLVGGCKSEEKGRTASLPPPLVGVMTVEERNVPVSFTYAGQTEGSRAVEVRAQVSGILMRRAYDEGQYVKQGQLLFEIEPDTYRAALRSGQRRHGTGAGQVHAGPPEPEPCSSAVQEKRRQPEGPRRRSGRL